MLFLSEIYRVRVIGQNVLVKIRVCIEISTRIGIISFLGKEIPAENIIFPYLLPAGFSMHRKRAAKSCSLSMHFLFIFAEEFRQRLLLFKKITVSQLVQGPVGFDIHRIGPHLQIPARIKEKSSALFLQRIHI